MTADVSRPGGTDGAAATLSTGHRVELPLSTTARVLGVALPASRSGVRSLLPESLRPVRATPTRAAVALLSVAYDRIGGCDIEPYDEFGVVLPAVPADASGCSAVGHVGGYVDFLPVTTDPARALGVDIWGYPKTVADVTHRDRGATRHTTVTVDGERFVDLSVDRPPAVDTRLSATSYTTATTPVPTGFGDSTSATGHSCVSPPTPRSPFTPADPSGTSDALPRRLMLISRAS